MTRPFLSAKGVACETNEHKQEFYIVSQGGLTSFLKKRKGLDKLCIQVVFHHIIYIVESWCQLVLFPDFIFRAWWKIGSGQLPNPFSFKWARMLVHCSFLIECLTALKIAFHIVQQQSTSSMDIHWASLVAVYRLCYSIFRKEHDQAVSEFSFHQSIFQFTIQLTWHHSD